MKYPLRNSDQARNRVAALERLIRHVDQRLKVAPAQGVAELEAQRLRLEEEHAALHEAVEVLEGLQDLPRCGCGKRAHRGPAEALRHVAALRLINGNGGARGALLEIYPCGFSACWHVGHGRTTAPADAEC